MKEKVALQKALASRDIKIRQLVPSMSKAAIARKFGISRERVRQIAKATA